MVYLIAVKLICCLNISDDVFNGQHPSFINIRLNVMTDVKVFTIGWYFTHNAAGCYFLPSNKTTWRTKRKGMCKIFSKRSNWRCHISWKLFIDSSLVTNVLPKLQPSPVWLSFSGNFFWQQLYFPGIPPWQFPK